MVSSRTIINAIIGAIVGVVLSFLPFSTVIGGVVAGFLEGPNKRDGMIVGALAGAITFVPIAGMAALMIGVLGFEMSVAAAPTEGFAVAVFVILLLTLFLLVYTVGLSLLGGYLGAVLAREYPDRRVETRKTIGLSSAGSSRGRKPPRPESTRKSDRLHDTDGYYDRDRSPERWSERKTDHESADQNDE